MAFDGVTIAYIKKEIENEALGLRVDKIYNPTREEIVLVLGGKKSRQLFISASSQSRIYFTNEKLENPMQPPMFCMLLRKHLTSSRISSVRQNEMDRVLFIDFNTRDSFGDEVTLTLSIEIMGRHSNIILIGPNGNVIDSIKRIGLEVSSVRQILPGIKFYLPPEQNKLNILNNGNIDRIITQLKDGKNLLYIDLMEKTIGLSPLTSKEICYQTFFNIDIKTEDLKDEDFANLEKSLLNLKNNILNNNPSPSIVFNKENTPMDFSALHLTQYEKTNKVESYKNLSEMIEFFYSEKYRIERIKSRSVNILRILNTTINRTKKKIKKQNIELEKSLNGHVFQKYGDLISANMYNIKVRAQEIEVVDLYSETGETVIIKLDSRLSPAKNAQEYYKKYKKSGVAREKLTLLIEEGKNELEYLETVLDTVYRSENEHELELISQELVEEGYIKKASKKGSIKKIDPYNYYTSSQGIEIISGKNNTANDKLSLKTAAGSDIWLHTQNIPGSHVVIRKNKIKDIDLKTITEAAKIAAFHSKARLSSNVAVDYTEIKNVKKQKGGKPGMVIYDNFKTIFVTPIKNEIENLTNEKNKKE